MLLNCGVGEDSWESLGLQGDPTSPSKRRSDLSVHLKDWCWRWNSNTLATWCEELTHWKRPWCWERLRGGGEGGDRGWYSWMSSPTQWTWVWVDSGSLWWTRRPDVLQFMELQRVGHDWVTELNWIHKRPHIMWFHLYETFGRGKSMKSECTSVVARGWERRELGGAAHGLRSALWWNGSVLELEEVLSPHCQCTKWPRMVDVMPRQCDLNTCF